LRVYGSGFQVEGLGFWFGVQGWGSGFMSHWVHVGLGFRVSSGFMPVWGSGLGFWVYVAPDGGVADVSARLPHLQEFSH